MIKVWFLIALLSYPSYPAIVYKGFGGFLNKEECEEKKITTKKFITDFELKMGRESIVETFCIETNAFPSSIIKKNDLGA
tara:strand:+ start:131 stop:370 length:240 start_codon:yes stop_codon:yes gene_type:complete